MHFDEQLVPFIGTDSFKLYSNLESAKSFLTNNHIPFSMEEWDSDYETVPNPWKVIVIDNTLNLFYAKNDKLFKIVALDHYAGTLTNGVSIGMIIDDAKKLDPTLSFDEWNEVWSSELGYWLEDDIDTKKIFSICVYIRELLKEDTFDYCEW